MEEKIFEDKAGNKLFKKYIKTRKIDQYFVKNKQGKLVNRAGFVKMVKLAGIEMKNIPKKVGTYKVSMRE